MRKTLIASLAVAASLLAAGAAQASNVHWSIGINLPPVGTVVSNAPVYAPAPVYVPAPVYAPPVVYTPAPVVYRPAPVVYRPAPVVYRPVPAYHGGWGDRDHDGIPNRYDRYDNRRGGYGDRDHDGIPNYRDGRDNRGFRH
jgi:hypothetical protein